MKIVGLHCYEGKVKTHDGSFIILVEQPDAFVIYRVSPQEPASEDARFLKHALLTRAEDFPKALAKFMPEFVALEKPIPVKSIPSHRDMTHLLRIHFGRLG